MGRCTLDYDRFSVYARAQKQAVNTSKGANSSFGKSNVFACALLFVNRFYDFSHICASYLVLILHCEKSGKRPKVS
jgi:hypothetical protein